MKTFTFDDLGNLAVRTESVDQGGAVQITQSDISAAQLAVHLPMLVADMSQDDLLHAQAVIKGLAK